MPWPGTRKRHTKACHPWSWRTPAHAQGLPNHAGQGYHGLKAVEWQARGPDGLKAVDRQVSGNFSCKASNQEGSKSSLTKPLVVSFPPVCRDQPRSLRVSLHQQVAVSCRVLAVPSSNVSFKWNFKAVEEDAVVEILGNQTKMNNLSSELKYTPRSTNDFGTLLCWADNGVEEMRKKGKIFKYTFLGFGSDFS